MFAGSKFVYVKKQKKADPTPSFADVENDSSDEESFSEGISRCNCFSEAPVVRRFNPVA
jgi:hypothetical protein